MNDDLRARAARQGGVFSTADARACGYDQRAVNARVASRQWHRLRRGWFVEATIWSASTAEDRHLLLARAVLLPLGPRQAASHTTGSLFLGVAHYRPDLRFVHTTHVNRVRGRTECGVVHHEGPLDLASCTHDNGVFVGPEPIVVAGAMLVADQDAALVVGDSALNRGIVTLPELTDVADDWLRYGGSRALRYRLSLLHPEAESPGETLSLSMFRRGGLPTPELQYRVDLPDGSVAYADFAWPEHRVLGEFDGKGKYLRDLRPGEEPGEAVFREKLREDRLRDLGWVVVRLVWSDLFTPGPTLRRFWVALSRGRSLAG
jgi:hypothetical protein